MKYKKEIEEVIDVIVDLAQSHSKQNAKDFLEYHQAVKELQALVDRAVVAERERVVDEILDFYKDSEFLAEYLSQLTDSEK